MSEMVERIGTELRRACLAEFGTTWDNDVSWCFARAAIAAMRAPTEEMVAAGQNPPRAPFRYVAEESMRLRWQAMIDAALR